VLLETTLTLDSKTLLTIFVYVHILQAFGLIYVRRIHNNYPPTLYWAVGSCCVAFGTLVSISRDAIPLSIAIVCGNTLMLSGIVILNLGIVVACNKKPPIIAGAMLLILCLTLMTWHTVITPEMGMRLFAISSVLSLSHGYSIFTILRTPLGPLKPPMLLLAGLLLLEILALDLRNYFLSLVGYDQLFQNNLIEISFALISITTTFLTAFAFATFTSLRLQQELRHAARHDVLTGLFNRRAFAEMADREWMRAARHDENTAMLMMDIDFFKGLNDQFGHHVGDIVLKEVSSTIRKIMRGEDIFCRYGGEEFAAFLVDTNLSQAKTLAERLRVAVSDLHIPEIGDYHLSISIGLAVRMTDHATWEHLITSADVALYQAKHEGRNRVCVYAPQTL